MVVTLTRTYFPDGTNGKLEYNGKFICFTIELPWVANVKRISCIPEGEYFISKRYSDKFHWHMEVLNVNDRSHVLIHPANNAQMELKGCIAPVTKLSGPGLGLQSRQAFATFKRLVYATLNREETVLLIVQSKNHL